MKADKNIAGWRLARRIHHNAIHPTGRVMANVICFNKIGETMNDKKALTAPCGLDCFNCELYEENLTDDFVELTL